MYELYARLHLDYGDIVYLEFEPGERLITVNSMKNMDGNTFITERGTTHFFTKLRNFISPEREVNYDLRRVKV